MENRILRPNPIPASLHVGLNQNIPPPSAPSFPGRQPVIRSRANITTACLACKRRKRKCSGGQPCPACSATHLECVYDIRLDRRRKGFNHMAKAEMEFQQRLLAGLLTAIRSDQAGEVLPLIKATASLEDLARLLGVEDDRHHNGLENGIGDDDPYQFSSRGSRVSGLEMSSSSLPPDQAIQDAVRPTLYSPQRLSRGSNQTQDHQQLSPPISNPLNSTVSSIPSPEKPAPSTTSLSIANPSRRLNVEQLLSQQSGTSRLESTSRLPYSNPIENNSDPAQKHHYSHQQYQRQLHQKHHQEQLLLKNQIRAQVLKNGNFGSPVTRTMHSPTS